MGLTIHYALHSDAPSATEARRLVEQLREAALGEVDELVEGEPEDDWLAAQAHYWLLGDGFQRVPPLHVIAFSTFPGPGSEPANFGLCRYPAEFKGRSTGLDGWHWQSFCKTQYASNPTDGGMENFLKAHLSVIRVLDRARELGILKMVQDEGRFWEDRDVEALVETVGKWNRHLAAFVGEWKDRHGDGFMAPITEYPNFEHLEAGGRDPDA